MVLKVCLQCGEEFEAKRSTAKYCSDKCKKRYQRGTKETRKCICGKEFKTNGKRLYCSDECSEWARSLHEMNKDFTKGAWSEHDDFDDDFIDYIDYK